MGLFSVASVAVLSLTKSVAISAARLGVRVNSVCLGMVEGDGSGGLWNLKDSGEAQSHLESMIPLGRLGKPSDAAHLVQFLISDRARYITERDLVILLKGAVQSFIAPDVPGSYRQCSHFRYITGVTVPHCYYLIHAPKGKADIHSILFMDKRTARQELWEGTLPNEFVLETTAGFDDLLPTKKIYEVVAKMASSTSSLFIESTDWAGTELSTILPQFAAFHGIKNHVVVSTIAGCRGFENESAIVGLLEFEARRRGAKMLAYPPVIAAGERANTIHYLDANRPIGKTDCVLMDAGCDFNGYVSDITSRMVDLIASVILEIGLVPQSTARTQLLSIAESLCPHHVSHYLGMDVHDCVTVSRDIDIPHGTVFTIEPGLYIPVNSQFPKEFRGIGLRIEDDIVNSTEGIEVLSGDVPRSADDIEYLMRSQ
uniref:AMP_N domain-containing protein n=1 Tax=Angiostrongylus cantonensis TaxID=6313 RepID=A0A0K0CTE7_ANGCA